MIGIATGATGRHGSTMRDRLGDQLRRAGGENRMPGKNLKGRSLRRKAAIAWGACAAVVVIVGAVSFPWAAGVDPNAMGDGDQSASLGNSARIAAAVPTAVAKERDAQARIVATAFTETRPTTGAVRARVLRKGSALAATALNLLPKFGSDPDLDRRRLTTDEKGEALFEGLLPGSYKIQPDYGTSQSVQVALDVETLVELVIDGGFDVEGEVVDDGAGKPVPGAEIYLDDGRRMSRVPTTRADAEGRFRLAGVPVGEVSLLAVAASRSCGRADVLGGEGDVVRTRNVCGMEAGDLEIRCLDEAGAPLCGAAVVLELGDEGSESWRAHASRLDSAGAALLLGVAAGPVFVRGRAADGRVADGDASVVVGETAHIELVFRRANQLSGVVVAEDGMTPVADAEVEMVNFDQFWMSDLTRQSDRDGRFTFPPFLTYGGVSLEARHPRLGYASEDFSAAACVGEVVVHLKLDARGLLRVRLVDAADDPVADAPIYVQEILEDGGEGDDVGWAKTGSDGRATVYDLPPDVRYRVGVGPFASLRGWFSEACTTETWAGAPEATLRLGRCDPATCVVRGRLLGPGDRPLGSVAVRFGHRTDAHSFAPMAVTDADGRFEARGLAPGEITSRLDDARTGLGFFESRTLAAGEVWDLGDRRVGEPGRLVFTRPVEGIAPRCNLRFDYGGTLGDGEWLSFDEHGRAERLLAAGTYVPTFGCEFYSGGGVLELGDAARAMPLGAVGAARLVPLHVAAGETRQIALPAFVTRPCTVSARLAPSESGSAPQITIAVALFGKGRRQTVVRSNVRADSRGLFTTTIELPLGTHQVWISSGDSAASSMVVLGEEADGATLEFNLRQ
jgi:hypothetical protein